MGKINDKIGKRRQYGAAASMLAVVLCLALPLAVSAFPQGPRLLVIMPPGSPADALMRAVRTADGRLLASSRFDWAALVTGEGGDFPHRLRTAGAWLVLEGFPFEGCEAVEWQRSDRRIGEET